MPRLAVTRPLACRIVDLADPTPGLRVIRLNILAGGAFRFLAGQYARVAFAEQRPRLLSMANRPDDDYLEFHVRHAADGGASAFAARELRVGDYAWVEGPFGDAYLRSEHAGPILAVAGGSGLAPIKAIVDEALATDPTRVVWLYLGARDETHVYDEAHFRRHQQRGRRLRLTVALSEPDGPTTRRVGTVLDVLALDLAAGALALKDAKAYVAGPPAMVGAARALLQAYGLAASDLHADALATPAARAVPR